MRILIAPDKFKGTLDAAAAARAIARGWRRVRPHDELTLLPMSDGGDGFGPVLQTLLHAKAQSIATLDAAGNPHRARWWWVEPRKLAILEAAQANGLALLPKGRHHPFDLDTTGVARLIQAALRRGARQCLVGVGGSATNDGGFGLARGLGWSFLDCQGHPIERWLDLTRLHQIVPPLAPQKRCRFIVATDVDNPLLGRHGATRVYGPQKGLRPEDLAPAEAALRRLAKVVHQTLGVDSNAPGSGAAGGLGFGLRAFLGAERRLGFDVFAEQAGLDRHLRSADLVLTGEGSFDRQSVMGKGVGQWVRHCSEHHKPVYVLAGQVAPSAGGSSPAIRWAKGLCDLTTREEALSQPARWLERLAREAARSWTESSHA